MREAIVDTSPLQYLYQIGLLDLLTRLYDQITIPDAVVKDRKAKTTESSETRVPATRYP